MVPRHATLLEAFVERYWDFYQSLQDYRAGPSDSRASALRHEFDELFSTCTGYAALDDRIAKTAAKKEELLTVLSEPSVPLHNNASELQARVSARRRDVSLHSRSAVLDASSSAHSWAHSPVCKQIEELIDAHAGIADAEVAAGTCHSPLREEFQEIQDAHLTVVAAITIPRASERGQRYDRPKRCCLVDLIEYENLHIRRP